MQGKSQSKEIASKRDSSGEKTSSNSKNSTGKDMVKDETANDGKSGAASPSPLEAGGLTTPSKSEAPAMAQMTPREIVNAKKEAKKKEDQQNLTFKPKINDKGKNAARASMTSQSVFTKLHETAKKVPERAPSPTPSVTALSPQVLATSVSRLHAGAGGRVKSPRVESTSAEVQVKAKKVSKEELSQSSQRMYREAEKLKAKNEEKKKKVEESMKKDYTFKPNVNATPKKDGKEDTTLGTMTHSERLQKYAADKAKRLEEAKKAREENELKGCSFKPKLNSRGGASSASPPAGGSARKPIPSAEDEECTFKPQLATSASKVTPAVSTTSSVSVHERLFKEGTAAIRDHEDQRQRLLEEEVQKKCTFAPQLTSRSAGESHTTGDVFTRLSQSRKEDLSEVKAALELSDCTFRPHISELAESVRTEGEVHERLNSLAETLRREAKIREELKVQNELKDATFSPEIPVISEVLALRRMENSGSPSNSGSGVSKSLAEEGVFEDHNHPASGSASGSRSASPQNRKSIGSSVDKTPTKAPDLTVVGSAMKILPSPEQNAEDAPLSTNVDDSDLKIPLSLEQDAAEASPAAVSELPTPTESNEAEKPVDLGANEAVVSQ